MAESGNSLGIDVLAEADAVIVRLAGDIDFRSSPTLRARLMDLVQRGSKRFILDLGHVGYVDSSGVGTMVEMRRNLIRRKGDVVLAGMQPRVRGVFEISKLDKFFTIADSVDQAREK